MKKVGIMLLLSVFFCEALFAQKYSDKIIINPKIKKQFKYRDTCVAVFDAFKDCRCFLDTVNKTIDIEAGETTYYLNFQIRSNKIVKVAHIISGDEIDLSDKNQYQPFLIRHFLIETNKDPFNKNTNGFLIQYKFGENRPGSTFWNKSNQYTGFINCHHITIHPKEYKLLSTADSLKLINTFLKSKQLQKTLKKLDLEKVKVISGYLQEWKMPVTGYQLLSYQELLRTKKNVLSIVVLPTADILNGTRIVTWRYWQDGKSLNYFGSYYYQKFKDEWVLMKNSMFNTNTKKSFLIR